MTARAGVSSQSRDEQTRLKERVDDTWTRRRVRIPQIVQTLRSHGCLHASELHSMSLHSWFFLCCSFFSHLTGQFLLHDSHIISWGVEQTTSAAKCCRVRTVSSLPTWPAGGARLQCDERMRSETHATILIFLAFSMVIFFVGRGLRAQLWCMDRHLQQVHASCRLPKGRTNSSVHDGFFAWCRRRFDGAVDADPGSAYVRLPESNRATIGGWKIQDSVRTLRLIIRWAVQVEETSLRLSSAVGHGGTHDRNVLMSSSGGGGPRRQARQNETPQLSLRTPLHDKVRKRAKSLPYVGSARLTVLNMIVCHVSACEGCSCLLTSHCALSLMQ